MALFRRRPKQHDQALIDLAEMFIACPDDPTPGAELLDASSLDFTAKGLGVVDDYLDTMRGRKLEDEAYGKLVLRCGAYVGEVISRNAHGKTYHWLDYNGAVGINKTIADFGKGLGTAAVLWDGADGLTFPLAKVEKFWANGREDSVQFFAEAMIEESI